MPRDLLIKPKSISKFNMPINYQVAQLAEFEPRIQIRTCDPFSMKIKEQYEHLHIFISQEMAMAYLLETFLGLTPITWQQLHKYRSQLPDQLTAARPIFF